MLHRTFGASLLAFTFASIPALAADCSTDADEVNVKCYPTVQAAADAALATDRPLLLPRGTYPITAPLIIDYSSHAGAGFELISRGATIDATGTGGPALEITAPVARQPPPRAASTCIRKGPYSSTPTRMARPS